MNISDFLYIKKIEYPYAKYLITEIVYVNELPVYIGIAPQGSATSDAVWIVVKLTYDANNNFIRDRISPENSVFDDYATLTYS